MIDLEALKRRLDSLQYSSDSNLKSNLIAEFPALIAELEAARVEIFAARAILDIHDVRSSAKTPMHMLALHNLARNNYDSICKGEDGE